MAIAAPCVLFLASPSRHLDGSASIPHYFLIHRERALGLASSMQSIAAIPVYLRVAVDWTAPATYQREAQPRKDTTMMFKRSTMTSPIIAAYPPTMSQRRRVGLAVAILLLTGVVLVTGSHMVGAQGSATPAPGTGITKETLGQETSAVAPDRVLLLARRTFAPGADSGSHPAPGPVVLFVESGSVTFSVQDGAALVTRAGATTTESVAAGSEVSLNEGDEVSYDQGVVHDVYNEGSVAAVTLEARLNPPTPAATATPTR
jgi:mannose-6-phosphate isomerase-like protein (cupin superfamily)